MTELYNKKTMNHFQNPQNMGEITDADGIGKVGNVKCGDIMYIYVKIGKRLTQSSKGNEACSKDNNGSKSHTTSYMLHATKFEEFIEDIKFKTLGCAAAIASSSVTTELAKGKSLKEAEAISRDDINEALGKLPAPKYHCSILAAEGIKQAIADYRSKGK